MSYLLESFRVPDSNSEVAGHCSHVFPVGVDRHPRDPPGVGPHHRRVPPGRDIQDPQITLDQGQ